MTGRKAPIQDQDSTTPHSAGSSCVEPSTATATSTEPESIRVRPMEPGDLEAIAHIVNHEIRTGTAIWTETPRTPETMEQWVAERRDAGCPVLVAEDVDAGENGRTSIVGFAGYGPFRKGEGYRFTVEHTVYVAANARRCGAGTLLMRRLIECAKADGMHRMVGAVSADQTPSLNLHLELGFREAGRLPEVGFKFDKWFELVLMIREL